MSLFKADPMSVHYNNMHFDKYRNLKQLPVNSKSFILFHTFLNKYGELGKLHKTQHQLEISEYAKGRCIGATKLYCEVFKEGLEKMSYKRFNNIEHVKPTGLPKYTEGITDYCNNTLHAYLTLEGSRHNYVLDPTRELDKDAIENSIYIGVSFELEFLDWVQKAQYKNGLVDTLPYLNSGCCVLTYRPLLEGKISEFPIHNDDINETIDHMLKN